MNDDIPSIREDGYGAFLRWYFKSRGPLIVVALAVAVALHLWRWWSAS
jgi:hypothetical protein